MKKSLFETIAATLAHDKLLHHVAGVWLSVIGLIFGLWLAVILPILVGLAKEIYDRAKGGRFSFLDWLATSLGSIYIIIINCLIY